MSNSISTGVAYKDPEFSDVTITGTLTVGGSVFNANELAALDGVTAGTVTANKAMIVDANKDIATVNNFAATAIDTDALTVTVSSSSTSGSVSVEPVSVSTTMTGAGGVGGRAKFKTTINAALGGWSNALKGEVTYGATGKTTGLGSAVLAEMTLSAGTSDGTYAPLEIELNVPSSASLGTATSFMHLSTQGANVAAMDTGGFLFNLQGLTAGSGKLLQTGTTFANPKATLKCKVGSTTYYLPLYDGQITT